MGYQPDKNRYQTMQYRRCGQSGLRLPVISLGLWHNFGDATRLENSRQLLQRAFDLGITHFDFAGGFSALARRADYLDESGIYHVGRPLRRLGIA